MSDYSFRVPYRADKFHKSRDRSEISRGAFVDISSTPQDGPNPYFEMMVVAELREVYEQFPLVYPRGKPKEGDHADPHPD